MAVRIRNRFHTKGQRSMAELASVTAVLAWKLALAAITRMREARYDIDIGRSYFDFVAEYTVFLAHAADRIAHGELAAEERVSFTTALATRLAEMFEENGVALDASLPPGRLRGEYLERFNVRGEEYADCGYDERGPDFGFRRVFAAGIQEVLPEKDRLWAIDQVMEIESPEAIRALAKTLDGLFHPERTTRRASELGGE